MYYKSNGELGLGPFTLKTRKIILEKLLELEEETKMELITKEELKVIDKMWDDEGDLSKRTLVELYYQVKQERLPWDEYKTPLFDQDAVRAIGYVAKKYDIPEELLTKLIISIDKNKHLTGNNKMQKEFDKILNQTWLHFDVINEELYDEN